MASFRTLNVTTDCRQNSLIKRNFTNTAFCTHGKCYHHNHGFFNTPENGSFLSDCSGISNMASGNMSLYRNHSISGDLSDQALSGLMILYIVTTFLSLIGNTLVVVVFVKGRRSRTDLRYFLINLAVSDLIMAAFCMPFTFADSILREWVFSPPMCPLVLFMQLLSVCGSVFTNMAIGIDRFMAVTFPLHSRITYRRGKYVIVIVWICSLSLASVQLFIGEAREDAPNKYECNEYWPDNRSRRIYTIFLMLMTYLLPLVILLVTYTIVGIILWRRTAPGNKHHVRDLHQLKSKIKVVKMLVIVVMMFGICWLPIHVFNVIQDFMPQILTFESESDYHLILGLYLSAHWLAMSNSFANPIIYGFTNEFFRADLVVLLHRCFPCCFCLRNLMIRTYSLSTYDSMIYRRNTMLRRYSTCNNNLSIMFPNHRKCTYHCRNGSLRPTGSYRVGTELRTKRLSNGFSELHHSHVCHHSNSDSAFVKVPSRGSIVASNSK